MSKKAIIIGAGPAGLTAGYELLKQTDIQPVILEASDTIGGISQTVNHNGNRMDIGGHRFFSKSERIMNWWKTIMPIQNGVDPEKTDRVMLIRNRLSRIYFLRKFFDYPISLKWQTFANMGLIRTVKAGFGYIFATIFKKKEDSLENFYINRFGKPLYRMFFEDYTEKVWGIHPSKLGADWGSQRVKGLSVFAIIKDMITKPFRSTSIDQKKVETSLIEKFIYPKYGPGQLWETVASDFKEMGGEIKMNCEATTITVKGNKVTSVNGMECDYLFSSMPIKDLIAAIEGIDIPQEVKEIATTLPYRDFITVGILAKKLTMPLKDTWIYIQERDVKVGRLQIFNNWSPYMVADRNNSIFIGMEYFATEGDELWTMDVDKFKKMAVSELAKIGLIEESDVIDTIQKKVKKAYPAYFGSYYQLDKVIAFLNGIENLFCVGRNGQHRYNNMDHSMLTAMEAVENIKSGKTYKTNIWNVNTEEEYHESK